MGDRTEGAGVVKAHELHNLNDASDLVVQKQHLVGEPQHELVVSGVVLRDEHRLSFLATEFGDHRQHTIALLARAAFLISARLTLSGAFDRMRHVLRENARA
jgi:hypothetical protein